MNTTYALIISNSVSWLLLLGLLIAVLALARQIGLLHERIKPVGALSLGKTIAAGEKAPEFTLPSLTGGSVKIGETAEKSTLLFFLSESCPVCKTLLPVLGSIREQERNRLRVVLASDGDMESHLSFISRHELQNYPYVLSKDVGLAYQISKLPYGVLIGADGKVVAHGLINSREHLESLLEAQTTGFSSIQAFQAAEGAGNSSLYKKVH